MNTIKFPTPLVRVGRPRGKTVKNARLEDIKIRQANPIVKRAILPFHIGSVLTMNLPGRKTMSFAHLDFKKRMKVAPDVRAEPA